MTNNYSIIDGKLYKDGIQVQPEVGNLEQIELIKNWSEGLRVTAHIITTHNLEVYFKCICGSPNIIDIEVDSDINYDDLNGLQKVCHNCKRVYEFNNDEDGSEENFIVKIKK